MGEAMPSIEAARKGTPHENRLEAGSIISVLLVMMASLGMTPAYNAPVAVVSIVTALNRDKHLFTPHLFWIIGASQIFDFIWFILHGQGLANGGSAFQFGLVMTVFNFLVKMFLLVIVFLLCQERRVSIWYTFSVFLVCCQCSAGGAGGSEREHSGLATDDEMRA